MMPEQKYRVRMIRSHLQFIEQSIHELDDMLNVLASPYESAIQLLCTIPGVDRTSAITIISEIGTDMSHFSSSKRLCCWAGLTPGNNESASKKSRSASLEPVFILSLLWFKSLTLRLDPRIIPTTA